jgi:hypothetical protein
VTPQDAAAQLVDALVAFDGVEPHNIKSIVVDPLAITLETFEVDSEGRKFIQSGGDVATATRRLPFRYMT